MDEAAWRRSATTLWRRITTGVVLLPQGVPEPVRLGGAATMVWDLLEEPTSVSEATDLLARACGEEPARIRPDIEAVIAELQRLGVAERDGPATC